MVKPLISTLLNEDTSISLLVSMLLQTPLQVQMLLKQEAIEEMLSTVTGWVFGNEMGNLRFRPQLIVTRRIMDCNVTISQAEGEEGAPVSHRRRQTIVVSCQFQAFLGLGYGQGQGVSNFQGQVDKMSRDKMSYTPHFIPRHFILNFSFFKEMKCRGMKFSI